jgi:hypothetical protein
MKIIAIKVSHKLASYSVRWTYINLLKKKCIEEWVTSVSYNHQELMILPIQPFFNYFNETRFDETNEYSNLEKNVG